MKLTKRTEISAAYRSLWKMKKAQVLGSQLCCVIYVRNSGHCWHQPVKSFLFLVPQSLSQLPS